MKVLFFGDVVGEPGLRALERELPALLERFAPDFVVANGENLDLTLPEQGRAGMTLASLERLFRLGVDAVTGGNHSFDPPDLEAVLGHPRVLRPLNYSPLAPGRGSLLLEKGEKRLLVVNVVGRSALPLAVEDPLPALERTLVQEEGAPVLVDFHSESVFEKMAAAYALDGRIAALLGTHTHVPTADARILPRGTAYVSDVGMVGAEDGMQGYDPAFLVAAYRLRIPPKSLRLAYAKGPVRVSYVFLELHGTRAKAIAHASFLGEGPFPDGSWVGLAEAKNDGCVPDGQGRLALLAQGGKPQEGPRPRPTPGQRSPTPKGKRPALTARPHLTLLRASGSPGPSDALLVRSLR